MEEVTRIPYGVANLMEVVEQNQYYVDKTMIMQFRGWALERMEEV